MPKKLISITPAVLAWAIEESGYTKEQVAEKIGVEINRFNQWILGSDKPSTVEFSKLTTLLKRQPIIFLLPKPPKVKKTDVEFRHPLNSNRKKFNPIEQRYLRETNRLQKFLKPIVEELHTESKPLPVFKLLEDKCNIANYAKEAYGFLGVSAEIKETWTTPSQAFKGWRFAMEEVGIMVFCFSLKEDSCRGFSLWHESIPIIVINTSWNYQARLYTLFHEFGHLLTRTNSVCVEEKISSKEYLKDNDKVERWCESFSASYLMPDDEIELYLAKKIKIIKGQKINDLKVAITICNHFNVSLRAAVLKLIDLGYSDWTLYSEIPPYNDRKKKGGKPPKEPRNRSIIRFEEYGIRVQHILVKAVDRDIISSSEALSFIDAPYAYLETKHRGRY